MRNQKFANRFFVIVLVATILGALSSCQSQSGKRNQARVELANPRSSFSMEEATALIKAGVLVKLDSTTRLPPLTGSDSSKKYAKVVYIFSMAENRYQRINY